MKILFISDVYFPRINGVSTSISTFVGQFRELGHEVTLIAPEYGIKTKDEAWIKRIPARNIYFDPEDKLMKYGQALDLLGELRREGYDLVHVHTPFVAHYLGRKLAHLLDVPCVETYHTFFEDYLHHYLPFLKPSIKFFNDLRCFTFTGPFVSSTTSKVSSTGCCCREPGISTLLNCSSNCLFLFS